MLAKVQYIQAILARDLLNHTRRQPILSIFPAFDHREAVELLNAFSESYFYHGNADHVFSGRRQDLKVLGQPPKSAQPG